MAINNKQTIEFSKFQSLGNDFVIIDNLNNNFNELHVKTLADRKYGIGCDQLILLNKSRIADVKCVIYNTDGSTAENCINGIRALILFIKKKVFFSKKTYQ